LAEIFMLWTLWNFVAQSIKRKSRAPARLLTVSQAPASAARVFNFPTPGSAVLAASSFGREVHAGPQPEKGSPLPQQLVGSLPR
jgi:hypothetical protein